MGFKQKQVTGENNGGNMNKTANKIWEKKMGNRKG